MVIRGVVEPISSVFVSLITVDYFAKQSGLCITEEWVFHDSSLEIPLNSIRVHLANIESKSASAISDSGEIMVEGKVKDDILHLILVGSYSVDVSLEGNLILCRQIDQPGMIGCVGNILGGNNVNISFMCVGRTAPKKQVIMAIGVDEEPPKDALRKVGEIAEEFVFLKL